MSKTLENILSANNRSADHAQYVIFAALLGLAYVLFYGWMLAISDFLPYVMDNNESFSSLWHAVNLYNFGFSKSFGLTDEAYGFAASAHPYVYTHQGNFPRLFALLIYALGARTIESQIVVTTFTIGFLAIYFAFHFFAKITNPRFALLLCLILITDYVLVAQWQIVTYRVWHEFFIFSTLLCVRAMADRTKIWPILAILNSAALFYFELVFGAFVSLTAAFYAATLYWRTPRLIVKSWAMQTFGAVLGLGLLVTQLVLYMGWDDFVHDAYLTFVARNQFSDPDLLAHIRQFYDSRNIVFWYNLQDKPQFSGLDAFIRSLTLFDWSVHTPLLSLIVWIVAAGWCLSLISKSVRDRIGAFVVQPARKSALTVALGFCAFTVTLFLLLLGASHFEAVRYDIGAFQGMSFAAAAPAAVCAIIGYFVAAAMFRFELRDLPDRQGENVAVARLVLVAGIPLALLALLTSQYWSLYDQNYQLLWREILEHWLPHYFNYMAVVGAVIVAAYLAYAGAEWIFGSQHDRSLAALMAYFASGYAAYAAVYSFSPGYIYSGYLVRHAPFTVFLNDALIAVAIYAAIGMARRLWLSVRAGIHAPPQTGRAARPASRSTFFAESEIAIMFRASGTLVAAALTLFVFVYWINLQSNYVKRLPPDHYAFLKTLAAPPYRGASFVVDNYAAPAAAYTGTWAYYDPMVGNGVISQAKDGLHLRGDKKYLWLADKDFNPAYRKPDYYLCMVPQSLETVLAGLQKERHLGRGYAGCGQRGLVRLAQQRLQKSQSFHLAAIDKSGPERIGFASWAIIKLGWDDGELPIILDWSDSRQ